MNNCPPGNAGFTVKYFYNNGFYYEWVMQNQYPPPTNLINLGVVTTSETFTNTWVSSVGT